ncbi:MAG: DUF2652 domain-containing protein [Chloroflexota bacterium]
MAEHGYFILADISGYTMFLNDSELEHAQEIITSLINAILDPIQPPILVNRIEGDAVFAYTTDNAFLQGQTLLESMKQLYFGFAYELQTNDRNTTCDCNACQNMHLLDLKMVVHYGEFVLQDLAGRQELIGSDVITAFRLLKNKIVEKTQVKSYLFISERAAAEMKLGEFTKTLIPHYEIYIDIGKVDGFVFDLAPAWAAEREKRRVLISAEEADKVIIINLPVPPAVAWDYLNEPANRAAFRGYEDRPVDGKHAGMLAVGTTYHCAHGDQVSPETIIDWKPFDYVTTYGFANPIKNMAIEFTFSTIFTPTPEGTQVRIHYGEMKLMKPRLLERILFAIFTPIQKMKYSNETAQWQGALLKLIEEDEKSGKLKMKMISAQAAEAAVG